MTFDERNFVQSGFSGFKHPRGWANCVEEIGGEMSKDVALVAGYGSSSDSDPEAGDARERKRHKQEPPTPQATSEAIRVGDVVQEVRMPSLPCAFKANVVRADGNSALFVPPQTARRRPNIVTEDFAGMGLRSKSLKKPATREAKHEN
uniref:Uncharacterized protein n=1 Tax=Compsopogon caeruleus TaxID=31354 RepID=A0A7S1TEP6_9RHOD|mmetsp:Transcript_3902/g.7485  ORF Transcript_3902/g.7485 Transcript_3902/m.7485 type:complete len:148 (+) Transcript_3902:107-550(+)